MTEEQATEATKGAVKVSHPQVWGLTEGYILEAWRKQVITIHLVNGETLVGGLVGTSNYCLALLREDKVILVQKGAVAWIAPGGVSSFRS